MDTYCLSSGSQESESKVSAGLAPSEAFLLGLLMTVFSLSPFLLSSRYACVSVQISSSKNTSQIGLSSTRLITSLKALCSSKVTF